MELVFFFLGLAALIIVVLGLFALGWRGRRRRQQDIPRPQALPEELSDPGFQALGQYVATTTAGDWLDRVALYGLGFKSNATAAVFPEGVLFARSGADDLWIPRQDLHGVRLERGMAGKFVEKEGLVTVTWQLGSKRVDTGFRTRSAEDKTPLVTAITELLPETATPNEEQL
ncbi:MULTISPECIES: hypothetical protein [unclassified Arthrobacter]|uniref:PH-like domain-containing protein n=1 Tax=unclassified Arthrobacter TaxID=235627 RepID=UPI001E29FF7C|nr:MULTISPECIES: hypothetical protein [unclassified Arthrobacter]MCC9145529.1 hypothetical protein [Arthrobacter sp. zg-Y919]MDK1276758.1 hypothetical protein [Arthrobacter sp. zg.Y919]MDM7989397.1 hypothetical protein [Arthrobacter sp. zg-Y877]WIB04300.1 hypothetical protein QNO10_06535 [Arthrobacter sp. zg-Y919]